MLKNKLLDIVTLSQAGIVYSNDLFDKARFENIKKNAIAILEDLSEGIEPEPLSYAIEEGYITPKVNVRGVYLNEDKILLVKEKSDNLWALPGGAADIGYSARENIEKEFAEETGLIVEATRLLCVFDSFKHQGSNSPYQIYTLYFLCEDTGKVAPEKGIETKEVFWHKLDALPTLSVSRNIKYKFV